MQNDSVTTKVALITGGARRIGAELVRTLHSAGYSVMIHCNRSVEDANALASSLNELRSQTANIVSADLNHHDAPALIIEQCIQEFGRLDVLINNASSFYPTVLEEATQAQWDDLVASNLKAPLFLAQACAPYLREQQGCIVNIVDIYAQRPLENHPIYCAAKAGLEMLTRSFARDLAPQIRVNAVSPGAILWPENPDHPLELETVLDRIPLKRLGSPIDIAQTVLFLTKDAPYITGQTIAVDGGRSVVN